MATLLPRWTTVMVTGAGGKLGEEVVTLLAQRDLRVVAGSRDPNRIRHLERLGAELRRVDFDDDEDHLEGAFKNVERLLLVSTDELATPGRRIAQQLKAVEAARNAGVKEIAYTSMPMPDEASPIPFAEDHRVTEAAILGSGMRYDILRNGWYFENLLGLLPHAVRDGVWYTAAGDGRIPYIARTDAARAAAASLALGMDDRIIDLCGPEAMSVEAMARAIRDCYGVELAVRQVPSDALSAHLVAQGVDAHYVPLMVITDINQALGRFVVEPGQFTRLTGAAPRRFTEFLALHRDELLGRDAGRSPSSR